MILLLLIDIIDDFSDQSSIISNIEDESDNEDIDAYNRFPMFAKGEKEKSKLESFILCTCSFQYIPFLYNIHFT